MSLGTPVANTMEPVTHVDKTVLTTRRGIRPTTTSSGARSVPAVRRRWRTTTSPRSPRGTPADDRHVDSFGVNTYRMVNSAGVGVLVKYHWKTQQGIASLIAEQAAVIQGGDLGSASKDLYEAIERGEYPRRELNVQIMSNDEHPEIVPGAGLWQRIVRVGAVIAAVTLGVAVWAHAAGHPWQSMAFLTLGATQLAMARVRGHPPGSVDLSGKVWRSPHVPGSMSRQAHLL